MKNKLRISILLLLAGYVLLIPNTFFIFEKLKILKYLSLIISITCFIISNILVVLHTMLRIKSKKGVVKTIAYITTVFIVIAIGLFGIYCSWKTLTMPNIIRFYIE